MKVAILTYHRVGTSQGADFPVKPGNFERQLNFIAASGYRVIELAELVRALAAGEPMAGKLAALTFDDGFSETCDAVCQVLRAHKFPATFFLIAGLVGKTAGWLPEGHQLIDWRRARRLTQEGFTIGSHSLTHTPMTQLSNPEAHDEIVRSKRVLEDNLGLDVRFFAYPYGLWDTRLRDLVSQAGYDGACTTGSGFNNLQADRFALRRIDISGRYSMPMFRRSLIFGENEMPLRREVGYYSRRLLSAFGLSDASHGS